MEDKTRRGRLGKSKGLRRGCVEKMMGHEMRGCWDEERKGDLINIYCPSNRANCSWYVVNEASATRELKGRRFGHIKILGRGKSINGHTHYGGG